MFAVERFGMIRPSRAELQHHFLSYSGLRRRLPGRAGDSTRLRAGLYSVEKGDEPEILPVIHGNQGG